MKRRRTRRGDGGRSAAVAYCVCAVYVNCIASLLCWAVLPWIAGFTPTLIASGSMAPRINTGDVVLVRDGSADDLPRGSVVTFDDPAHPGRLLTHRLVAQNADGTYRTKGDANSHPDSSPVEINRVRGVGRAVIPAVGLPMMWARSGNWVPLLLWIMGTLLAAAYLRAYGHRLPVISSWSTSLVATPAPGRSRVGSGVERQVVRGWEPPLRSRRRIGVAATAGVAVLALVVVVLPRVTTSQAAWAAATRNPNNQLAAATSFCTNPGTQTLAPAADAKVDMFKATTNYGATTDLVVTSRNNKDARTLLRFTLPAVPAGCAMTASLRLYASSVTAGRNLQAWAAAAAWSESTVTWNTAPGTAGTAVTVPSLSAAGWMAFGVTDHVAAMYAGSNHGFLVKDQVEGSIGNDTQTFSSREALSNQPELVLTFGAPAGARPAAPSALSATTASASRVNLAWTDNATDETSYTVQRSAGGANNWSVIATLAADTVSYGDTGLASATTYDYRVRATNASGDSGWSNIASATTAAAPAAPPNAPTALVATTTGVDSATLSWTDNATDEDAFTIQRSPAGAATWTQIGSVGADVTTFAATGLTANTAYDFRVQATNNAGGSEWSNIATATTATCATLAAQTLVSVADSLVLQSSPDTKYGSDAVNFGIRSWSASNGRSLVRFEAPKLSGGCAVTGATLRVYESSGDVGRTIQALQVAAPWTESMVTWNNQPVSTGTAATVTSALGWNQWDVTSIVGGTGAGAPDGFLLRDAVEDAGTALRQYYSPREGSYPPQLVVRFD